MAARRAQQQPASMFAPLLLVGIAGMGVAVYYGYPGIAAVLLAVVIAGWMEPRPLFTGPKDSYGAPTPNGPKELSDKTRYQVLSELKWRLIFPSGGWLPGWWPRANWFVGVAAGILATLIPADEDWYRIVNGACVAIMIAQIPPVLDEVKNPEEPSPGVRLDSLGNIPALAPIFFGGLVVGIGAGVGTVWTLGKIDVPVELPFDLWFEFPFSLPWYGAATAVLVTIGIWYPSWRTVALAEWRTRVDMRSDWEARWTSAIPSVNKTGTPRLIRHQEFESLTVYTFEAPASLGAAGIMGVKQKVATAYGAGFNVAILHAPNTNEKGEPLLGTVHPTQFEVVTFPADEPPNISSAQTSSDEAQYAISAALSMAVDAFGGGGAQYVFNGIEPLHEVPEMDEEPQGWARLIPSGRKSREAGDKEEEGDTEEREPQETSSKGAVWSVAYGGANTLQYARTQYMGMMYGHLAAGTEILVNDWPENHHTVKGGNRIYVGAITDPGTIYADDADVDMLQNIMVEDEWLGRWNGVLKSTVNAPEIQHAVITEAQLGRSTIHYTPFVFKQGEEMSQFEKLEPKLSTTLNAAPFVSVLGFPAPGGRPGDRHPQAFVIVHSHTPVPVSADKLPASKQAIEQHSTSRLPEHWVLAGHLNAAFDSARLARPELMTARPLTRPGPGARHIWKLDIRLYGGVTLSQVQAKLGTIMSSMSVPWLQVTPGDQPQTITMVLGQDYRRARLNSDAHLPYLQDLEWQQAWADAKLVNTQGLIPVTKSTEALPANDKVFRIDFELPSGITPSRVKGAVEKLKGSTKNEFIEVRPGALGAGSVQLLVCEEDPMPFPAPIDFEFIDSPESAGLIPFATGVEGEPVSWNVAEDVHLLIVGGSGSGKSATLQMLMYPMLRRGWDLYVADPVKSAADFHFAKPWLKASATTIEDASAMMDAVYAEVSRRRDLNGKHGVGSYTELPEDVRPNHAVVIVDEFTSLITVEKLSKPQSSDPEILAEYAHKQMLQGRVINIGDKVGRIAREARSAGVTLVLATQRLTAKDLEMIPGGNSMRTNMSRLLLGKANFGEMQSALKSPESAPDIGEIVPKGRGLLETAGSPTQIIQSWYDHPIQEVLTSKLLETGIPNAEPVDLAPFYPKADEMVVEGAVLAGPGEVISSGPQEIDLGEIDLDLDLGELDFGDLDLEVDVDTPEDDTPTLSHPAQVEQKFDEATIKVPELAQPETNFDPSDIDIEPTPEVEEDTPLPSEPEESTDLFALPTFGDDPFQDHHADTTASDPQDSLDLPVFGDDPFKGAGEQEDETDLEVPTFNESDDAPQAQDDAEIDDLADLEDLEDLEDLHVPAPTPKESDASDLADLEEVDDDFDAPGEPEAPAKPPAHIRGSYRPWRIDDDELEDF